MDRIYGCFEGKGDSMFLENEKEILASFVEEEIVTILNRYDKADPLLTKYRETLSEILGKLKMNSARTFGHRLEDALKGGATGR